MSLGNGVLYWDMGSGASLYKGWRQSPARAASVADGRLAGPVAGLGERLDQL
ncbi:MAG: hypothetical protein ACJAZ5_000727 [Alloalcanivorax venustensis]|jgi:hypothetical protein